MLSKNNVLSIKGIAILMIVLSHLMYITQIQSSVEKVLHPLGYLGVALFLFVSGYGCRISLETRKFNKKIFLKKRFASVVPELVVVTVLFAVIGFAFYGIRTSALTILANSIGISSSMAKITWYILFQYFWYVILLLSNENKKRSLIIVWLSSIIVYLFSVCFADFPMINFAMWGLNCFSFPLGVTAAIYRDCIKEKNSASNFKPGRIGLIASIVAFFAMFIVCYIILHNPSDPILQNILKSIISGSFAVMVFFAFVIIDRRKKQDDESTLLTKLGGGGTTLLRDYLV